jgi:hypothetical protein
MNIFLTKNQKALTLDARVSLIEKTMFTKEDAEKMREMLKEEKAADKAERKAEI